MNNLDLLAASLLRHLRAEEALLREALGSLTRVHASLRQGDLAAVSAAQPAQEALVTALWEAHAARLVPAEALGAVLGIPSEELTLSALVAQIPGPWATQLDEIRTQLNAIAAEIATLQRRNANLIAHLRSFLRGALSALTGADAPVRYGPSGSRLSRGAGRAIQASG